MPFSPLEYRVDAEDRLCGFSPGWDRFAVENGAPHLLTTKLLGLSLWDFVSGVETRQVYREIMSVARTAGNAGPFLFRCDSPTLGRILQMEIVMEGARGLVFRTRLIETSRHPRQALLDPQAPRSDRLVTICSACKKLQMDDRQWLELGQAINRLELFLGAPLPQLSHGFCPRCHALWMNALPPRSPASDCS